MSKAVRPGNSVSSGAGGLERFPDALCMPSGKPVSLASCMRI